MAGVGVPVEVLCGDNEGTGPTGQEREGVTIRTVRAFPRGRDWFFAPAIWGEMKRARPDVVHVQSFHTLVAPLAMLRALVLRVPYVVTFHGGGSSSQLRNRARGLQMRLLRPLLSRAARLVAVAHFEIEEYGRLLRQPAEKFVLIPNGTDLAFADDGVPAGEPAQLTLATIGRLERYKGHHRVIGAMPAVLKREPAAKLLVVGSGPYETELRELAGRLGVADAVSFVVVPSDDPAAMARLLAGVSMVVLMSEFETHPLVALEAAAARRRLLVADRAGLGELAAAGHARGIDLHSSAEELAGAIFKELGCPAPAQAPDLTSWDECTAGLVDLYASVA